MKDLAMDIDEQVREEFEKLYSCYVHKIKPDIRGGRYKSALRRIKALQRNAARMNADVFLNGCDVLWLGVLAHSKRVKMGLQEDVAAKNREGRGFTAYEKGLEYLLDQGRRFGNPDGGGINGPRKTTYGRSEDDAGCCPI